jgi:hypothetical protein
MVRGIEKTLLFRTAEDRTDFLRRLATQVEPTGVQILAWALLPNHLHLLLRTGHRPLVQARSTVGALAVRHLGLPASGVAEALGVTSVAILRSLERGLASLLPRRIDPARLAKEALRKAVNTGCPLGTGLDGG